jgi:maleate isomerase
MNTPLNSPLRRLGLLVPSSNTVLEPDFYKNLPPGWMLHSARMFLEDVTAEAEARMLDEFVLPAARDLATAHPHVVVFGCTSAGALRGNDYDEKLCREISLLTHVPTISVIKSVAEALKEVHAEKVVVITPYIDELNLRIQASLEYDGLKVLRIQGLGINVNTQIAQVPGVKIIELAKSAVEGLKPDALFISCTNIHSFNVLPELRRLLPFPVISSNQAALDAAIKMSNRYPTPKGLGDL